MKSNLQPIYGTGEDKSYIIQYFEDFYCEVIRLKNEIIEIENAEDSSIDPEIYVQKIVRLLTAQAKDASRYGGEFASKYYQEAQYIMAALADEVFLHLDWSGKKVWEDCCVERKLFGTHNAGEAFFTNLDQYLKTRDPSHADIGMLYLLALGLGFKGQYRRDEGETLRTYSREIYILIHRRDPQLFQNNVNLFPNAYDHTLTTGKVKYLNDFKPWVMGFGVGVFILLLFSYWIWEKNTGVLQNLIRSTIQSTQLY